MSLFLGNLSSHVHPEELERVFRRFGRCDVQLKDGYGFVIYQVPENAERALRSLRGKQICGENIALDWSKKQPRPFQRFSRGRRFYEPFHGRNFREEDNGERNKDPRYYRNFAMGRGRRPTFSHRGHHFDEMNYSREDVGSLREEKVPSIKERTLNEGGAVEPNPAGNGRWGEPVNGSSDDNGAENEAEFERYEPFRGFDRRDDNEHQIPGSDGSPVQVSSPDKGRREHSSDAAHKQSDNPKPHLTCFGCGLAGHKMRDCPQGDRSRREKLDRFERRNHETNFKVRHGRGLKRKVPASRGRPNAGRDSMLSRPHAGDGKGSQSQKPRKVDRRGESSPESTENHHCRAKRESGGRKRGRHESGTPKKERRKRSTRRSLSSSLHSDSVASSSRSKSRSSRSVSGVSSHSRSRSVSSRSHSESSSSRSVSSYSKSRSSRSRSMTRSRTRSLSVSLDQNIPASPKDVATVVDSSAKDAMEHVSSPESKEPLVANSNAELKGVFEDENAFTFSKVDVDTYEEQGRGDGCEDENFSDLNAGLAEKDSCMDLLDKVSFSSEKSSENLGEENNLGEAQSDGLSHQIHVGIPDSKCTKMSLEEMCTVLKHYGFSTPEEIDPGLSVGGYFGAARLWPWEVIYCRRLKKGPITTENYARRITQNKEFGIMDKYIRSSSGWGESEQNDS
uniref:Serine/arginine-rich splicing factor 6 n=1 Tax=Anthurium amnicola TaxID=1678845 RepID=A0A1D1Z6X9_9ARAE